MTLLFDEQEPAFPESLHEQMMDLAIDNQELREGLERVRSQYLRLTSENIGWSRLTGGIREVEGLELSNLKEISQLLREEVAGSALPKRANEARYAYTFGKPLMIEGLDDQLPQPKRRGRPSSLESFYNSESARRHVFSDEAKAAMHAASATDGIFILQGNNRTKEVHPIPLHQIDKVMTNPDFDDEVWAYLRKWDRKFFDVSNNEQRIEQMSEWIYTDTFKGERADKIGDDPVAQDKTIIDAVFNRQTGWTFGVPDLMAGQVWNQKYLRMVSYGEQVTETLAYFAAKVKVGSKAGADNVGLRVANPGQAKGQVVTYGAGNEVDVFSTAGKAYDFGSLKIFSAFYAASVGIPLTDLTADPSAAGASYGSAAALLPGARRLIEARRLQWATWYRRVLKWATGEEYNVIPASIEEEQPYHAAQKIGIAWGTGLFHEEEIRPALARIADIPLRASTAPEGVLLPNNEASEQPETDEKSFTASPDQGKKNNTGGQSDIDKKQKRTDTISSEAFRWEMSERLEKIEGAILHLLENK